MIRSFEVNYNEEHRKPFNIMLLTDELYQNYELSEEEFRRVVYALNDTFVQFSKKERSDI